jgi:hypothetical protein
MIKKYALVSTSYYDCGIWKSFYILIDGLTEDDVQKIKFYSEEYSRLWKDCYEQERENAKKSINVDLRTDLKKLLNKSISETDYYTIEDYYKLWSDKDLIIEHYEL